MGFKHKVITFLICYRKHINKGDLMKPNKDNKIILSEKTQREMLEFFMETSVITKLKKASIQDKKRIGESNERIKKE